MPSFLSQAPTERRGTWLHVPAPNPTVLTETHQDPTFLSQTEATGLAAGTATLKLPQNFMHSRDLPLTDPYSQSYPQPCSALNQSCSRECHFKHSNSSPLRATEGAEARPWHWRNPQGESGNALAGKRETDLT